MTSIRERARRDWAEAAPIERVAAVLLGVIAFAMRLAHLRQTMRHDEAYTFLHYAKAPLATALSDYTYPNNHLFHTLLVGLSTRLLGTSPPAIRLPAFVAGMLTVPMVYVLARRFADRSTSLLAMALAAVWPALVLYSTNARGHAIVTLGFVVLLVVGDLAIDRESSWPWLVFALVIAIGVYTAPTMLYPAGAAMPWVAMEADRRHGATARRAVTRRLAVAGALAAVLTVMFMLPVVVRNGLAALVANKQVAAVSFAQFLVELRVFAGDIVASNALGIPLLLLVALTLLGITGVLTPGADRSRRLSLALITLLWSAVLLVAGRRPPPGRVLQFIVPLACVYVAIGARVALARLVREQRLALNALTCVIVPALAAYTLLTRSIFRAPESGTLVDAPQIADYLLANMRPGDRIAFETPSGPSLDYYLVRKGGRPAAQVNADSGRGRVFVVVNPRHLQTLASVQKFRRDFDWRELVPAGAPVSFAPESVFVFRYVPRN